MGMGEAEEHRPRLHANEITHAELVRWVERLQKTSDSQDTRLDDKHEELHTLRDRVSKLENDRKWYAAIYGVVGAVLMFFANAAAQALLSWKK